MSTPHQAEKTPTKHATLSPVSPRGIYMLTLQFDVPSSPEKYSVCLVLDTKNFITTADAERARCKLFWSSSVTDERVFIALPYLYNDLAYYQQHNQLLQSLGITTVGDLSLVETDFYQIFRQNFKAYDDFYRFLFESHYYAGTYQTLFWQSQAPNLDTLSQEILQNAIHCKSAPHQDLCSCLAQVLACAYDSSDLAKTDIGTLDCSLRLLKNAKAITTVKPLNASKLLHDAIYSAITHVHFSRIYPAFAMLYEQEKWGGMTNTDTLACLPLSLQFLIKLWLNPTGESLPLWCQTDGFLPLLFKDHHVNIDAFNDTPLAYDKYTKNITSHQGITAQCQIAIAYLHKPYTPHFVQFKDVFITDPLAVFLWSVSRVNLDTRAVAVVAKACFNLPALAPLLTTSRRLKILSIHDHYVVFMDKTGTHQGQTPRSLDNLVHDCLNAHEFYHQLEPDLLLLALSHKKPHTLPLTLPNVPDKPPQSEITPLSQTSTSVIKKDEKDDGADSDTSASSASSSTSMESKQDSPSVSEQQTDTMSSDSTEPTTTEIVPEKPSTPADDEPASSTETDVPQEPSQTPEPKADESQDEPQTDLSDGGTSAEPAEPDSEKSTPTSTPTSTPVDLYAMVNGGKDAESADDDLDGLDLDSSPLDVF